LLYYLAAKKAAKMTTKKKLPTHHRGSGNIFADLGLPNAEEHQLKAALVVQLKRMIAERKLTQRQPPS
jgi:predicted XRE-type DNA-binding protein